MLTPLRCGSRCFGPLPRQQPPLQIRHRPLQEDDLLPLLQYLLLEVVLVQVDVNDPDMVADDSAVEFDALSGRLAPEAGTVQREAADPLLRQGREPHVDNLDQGHN